MQFWRPRQFGYPRKRRLPQILRHQLSRLNPVRIAPPGIRAVIIAAKPVIIVTTTQNQLSSKGLQSKMGSRAAPHFALFCCVGLEALQTSGAISSRRAPRARCDQLLFGSKPGGVILFSPEPDELTLSSYASAKPNASEETEKSSDFSALLPNSVEICYLMKRVSRSWSRPTKDLLVRNRLKRS